MQEHGAWVCGIRGKNVPDIPFPPTGIVNEGELPGGIMKGILMGRERNTCRELAYLKKCHETKLLITSKDVLFQATSCLDLPPLAR